MLQDNEVFLVHLEDLAFVVEMDSLVTMVPLEHQAEQVFQAIQAR